MRSGPRRSRPIEWPGRKECYQQSRRAGPGKGLRFPDGATSRGQSILAPSCATPSSPLSPPLDFSLSILEGVAAVRARRLARKANFRIVRFADAPLEIVWARASVYESGLVDPSLEVRNRAGTGIVDFQVGWLLQGASRPESRAATISGSGRASASRVLVLPPGESFEWSDSVVLETGSDASGPFFSGRVYLRAVQLSDGRIWVPERSALEDAGLGSVLPPSSEMIRLLRFYQARGPQALSAELHQ